MTATVDGTDAQGDASAGILESVKGVTPRWAKEAVRPFMHAYGRATSGSRPLPEYLIIGTKRGGSTSLFKYLTKHPNVLPPWPAVENHKKTNFFDREYHRGEAWYRAHFPSQSLRDRVSAAVQGPVITGEGGVNYMFNPLVFERVQTMLPDVKLVVALRNPVDRAWSHYHERVKAGTEPLGFEEALDAEEARLAGEVDRMSENPRYYSDAYDFFSYQARGRYLEHLGPWLDAYLPDRLLVLRSEDMYTDPVKVVLEMQAFLGLPAVPPVPHRYNYIPTDRMEPRIRERLTEYYRPHVRALEQRLSRSFDWGL